MAENMCKEEMTEMLQITEESVRKLSSVWMKTFEPELCRNNLRRLIEHTKNYYSELVLESVEKQTYIESEIAELREEAESLRRLLKTEIHLPHITAEAPLLLIQREMDKSLTELREQLRQRREQICELLLEQETLCDELGAPPRPLLADPLPTTENIDEFRAYLDSLKEERVKRMQQLLDLRREIKSYLQILDMKVNTEADDYLLNHRQIKLNVETFENLEKLRRRFEHMVENLKTSIDSIRQKLPLLWERLNTPQEERRKIERYTEYNQVTYDILYQELDRCEEIKRKNIKQYITKIRIEIAMWWNKTLKSDVERSRFSNYNSQDYTDELLTLHEMELEDLKQYYERYSEIFELYENRKILWERMNAIEQKANDPARYNNRGGQLLKEEKERKTIATKLPKIEEQIRELVLEYEEREHVPFFVYGENILEIMENEWLKKKQDKEAISTARKKATTPQTNRSQLISASRTPLIQRSASSVLRKTPSTISLSSSKQIYLGSSAQKRKLNPSEKTTPLAKRSLFVSPNGVFRKPPIKQSAEMKIDGKLPTQMRRKLPRVIGTTIRRSSGRISASGAIKKRRSVSKTRIIPRIHITTTDDENYDEFKQRIEPDSRSSIKIETLSAINEKNDQKLRLKILPKPQIKRTPSKQNLRDYPLSPGMGTSSSSCRKLTTKNLPIII